MSDIQQVLDPNRRRCVSDNYPCEWWGGGVDQRVVWPRANCTLWRLILVPWNLSSRGQVLRKRRMGYDFLLDRI